MKPCTCSRVARLSTVASMIPTTWTAAAVVDACVRLGLEPRVAPAGLTPLEPGMRVQGRALPARHFGSVDVFLEALNGAPEVHR